MTSFTPDARTLRARRRTRLPGRGVDVPVELPHVSQQRLVFALRRSATSPASCEDRNKRTPTTPASFIAVNSARLVVGGTLTVPRSRGYCAASRHVVVVVTVETDARNDGEANAVRFERREQLFGGEAVARSRPRIPSERHVLREDVYVRVDDGRLTRAAHDVCPSRRSSRRFSIASREKLVTGTPPSNSVLHERRLTSHSPRSSTYSSRTSETLIGGAVG